MKKTTQNSYDTFKPESFKQKMEAAFNRPNRDIACDEIVNIGDREVGKLGQPVNPEKE